jgi:phosphatidylinositol alpha-1,6-mannosyltransferase
MEILVITWNFPPRRGGIEYLVSNLCAGLRERHSVRVITAHVQSVESVEEEVFRAPWPGVLPFALYALWCGARLLVRNRGVKIILGGSVLVTPLVLFLARLFGRKAVVQAHGLDLVYRNFLYQQLCVRWIKLCERIVANSAYTASRAVQKGARPDQIAVIPPGVYPERFAGPVNVDAIKKEFGLEGKQIILFVGRLAKRKGVKAFIEESLVKIVREVPNACFVIVGDNPSESLTHRDDALGEIRAVVTEMQLQDHIRLLGSLSDEEVVKLYQACDVVLLPALAQTDDVEGFGIVLVEAAAAGKPAVATRVGGIPDAVEDGKGGILVEPGDYEQFAGAVIALLRDGRRNLMMGECAQRRVKEKFCWGKIIDRYELALGF